MGEKEEPRKGWRRGSERWGFEVGGEDIFAVDRCTFWQWGVFLTLVPVNRACTAGKAHRGVMQIMETYKKVFSKRIPYLSPCEADSVVHYCPAISMRFHPS